jgi:hypothetical protein
MLSVASCCNILMAHVNNHDQSRSYIKALWMFFVTLLYIPDRLPFFFGLAAATVSDSFSTVLNWMLNFLAELTLFFFVHF